MANWNGVRDFIKGKYTVAKDDGDYLAMVFNTTDGRDQLVSVKKIQTGQGEVWVQISSPVGYIPIKYMDDALELLDNKMCGGLVKIGDKHFVRHCMPVADLSTEELDDPLHIVINVADELEKKFVGGDEN